MSLPKLSIITPSFNQGRFIEETIRSVLDQGYPGIEYIVIDGGSTDGSVEVLQRYGDRLAGWVSEPDRGQVHAINKGLSMASGDVVAYLNSDDLYLPGALHAVGRVFGDDPSCRWICGDTLLFGADGADTGLIRAVIPRSAAHCLSWAYKAPQPGMFWRRELLRDGFQERWRYCFDHELYVRLLLDGYRCRHLPLPLAAYRLHSSSKTVAESAEFDREFDQIAETYENRLEGRGRRWTKATRFLRRSYASGSRGDARSSLQWLLRALLIHPEGLLRRPFWGCLRRALAGRPGAST